MTPFQAPPLNTISLPPLPLWTVGPLPDLAPYVCDPFQAPEEVEPVEVSPFLADVIAPLTLEGLEDVNNVPQDPQTQENSEEIVLRAFKVEDLEGKGFARIAARACQEAFQGMDSDELEDALTLLTRLTNEREVREVYLGRDQARELISEALLYGLPELSQRGWGALLGCSAPTVREALRELREGDPEDFLSTG